MSGTTPNAFGTLIADARSFYADLAQNNTKAWFTEHKSHYDTALKTPAKLLLDQIAPHVAELSEGTVKTKLYRPHRDIRFSKDKTPYSLHLHMLWSPQGNGTQPGYFFGISEQYVTAGAGIMAFDKAQQTGWRAWVSEIEGDALQARIDTVLAEGGRIDAPALKRIPAPFDKDHPRGDLLRRKSLTLWKDIAIAAENDLTAAIQDAFTLFNPVMDEMRSFL